MIYPINRTLNIIAPEQCSLLPIKLNVSETLSAPFVAELSVELNHSAEVEQLISLLNKPITLQVCLSSEGFDVENSSAVKTLHGIVQDYDLSDHTAVLFISPWLKLLDKTLKYRIFQQETVVNIVKKICNKADLQYELAENIEQINLDTTNLTAQYAPINYCVQYNETDFAFISRILAQAGIYYCFKHQADKHTMVLYDNSLLADKAENTDYLFHDQSLTESHVYGATETFQVVSNVTTLNHYNYLQPVTDFFSMAPDLDMPQALDNKQYFCSQMNNSSGNARAVQQEALRAALLEQNNAHVLELNSNILAASLNTQFELKAANSCLVDMKRVIGYEGLLFITGIEHTVTDNSQRVQTQEKSTAASYSNTLVAIPAEHKFMPSLIAPPEAGGLEQATVLADTDPESLASIKVRFDWPTHPSNTTPHDSCWLRTSQRSAHENAGHQFIPRAGDKVFIKYLGERADQPMVKGSPPSVEASLCAPDELPEHKSITSIYTTTPGQTLDKDNAQHLLFDDTPGAEQISLLAAGNLIESSAGLEEVTVENHYTKTIHGNTYISAESIEIKSAKQLSLQAGDSQLLLTPEGVQFITPNLKISPTGVTTSVPIVEQSAPAKKKQKTIKLIIDICDRTNQANPDSTPPVMADEMEHLSLKATYIGGIHSSYTLQDHLSVTVKQAQAVIDDFDKNIEQLSIRLYSNNSSSSEQSAQAAQTDRLNYYQDQCVYIIGKNGQSLNARPDNKIILTPQDWQQKPASYDEEGNLCYHVSLTILEPLFLFNFRQDAWGIEMDPNTLPLEQFFEPKAKTGIIDDQFPEWVLDHYQKMGNNITFFIHGYNVAPGELGDHYTYYPPRPGYDFDDIPMVADGTKTTLFYIPSSDDKHSPPEDTQNGTQAYNWLLSMEHNLNQAAGFDGKDFSKYTRLIGITWQGNPKLATDYTAAIPMAHYPAEKLFKLIKQCSERGIKINIVAHSLGNAVLMQTLNLCGEFGIQVDHSFLWDAAIPNNSFETETNNQSPNYFPMMIDQQRLAYEYCYPYAQQASKAVTVLYSEMDNILGPVPLPRAYQQSNKKFDSDLILQRIVHDIVITVIAAKASWFYSDVQDTKTPDDDYLAPIISKADDPGAGLLSTLPSLVIYLLDQPISSSIDSQWLRSIYNVANLFVNPLSDLLVAKNYESYYQRWANHYGHFQHNHVTYAFSATLEAQQQQLKNHICPEVYQALVTPMRQLIDFSKGKYAEKLDKLLDKVIKEAEKTLNEQPKAKTLYSIIKSFIDDPLGAGLSTNSIEKNYIKDKLKAIMENSLAHEALEHWEALLTIILSVLFTASAAPATAMGYRGAKGDAADKMDKGQQLFQTPQQDPSGKDLCIDHCAMHYPSDEMKKWVFKGELMYGTLGQQFKYFGKYLNQG